MRAALPALALSALSALSASCQLIVGIGDFDPGVPEEVTGIARVSYFTGAGRVERPEDWSGAAFSAYTVEPSGELAVYAATTSADGSFAIPVPPDREHYYLRIQREGKPGQIYRLTGRSLDLSSEVSRRPDLEPRASAPSLISLTLDGMSPRGVTDRLYAYAPGVGSQYIGFTENAPAEGATRLADARFDWAGQPLLQGEDLWVIQERSHPAGPGMLVPGSYAVGAARIPALQQTQGAVLPATGAFTAAAPIAVSHSVDLSALRRLPGEYASDGLVLYVTAGPDGDTDGGPAVLTWTYETPLRRPALTHALTYGDPFPPGWSRRAIASYYRIRRYYKGGPASAFGMGDAIQTVERATSPFASMPVPELASASWVQNITVDGARLDRVRIPDTRPVRLAWDPAPGAAHYRVAVYEYPRDASSGLSIVAELASAVPELLLPPDFLPAEAKLAFYVSAIAEHALEPAPRLAPQLGTGTGGISDILYTSATCGNGRPDPGEACDSGDPSAMCDFDCTPAVCGDGVRNAAAGEQCDSGGGSLAFTCDAQCRTVLCGDGVLGGTEECDDGNTISGDGCSAGCAGEP